MFCSPSYNAEPIGYSSFDTITGGSAASQNLFVPDEVENTLGYSGGRSSGPKLQPSSSTWPVPVQDAWIHESGGIFLQDQSYNALPESMVATCLPPGLEYASLSNPYRPLPGESAQLSEAHVPIENAQVQDYSLIPCPEASGAPLSAHHWQPNTHTLFKAIPLTSLAVPSISVDQPPSEWPAGYLLTGLQYSSTISHPPIRRGAATISCSATPRSRQGLCELRAPAADSQIGESSTSSLRLVPTKTGASCTKRKERLRSHVSLLPSPDMPSNPTRHVPTRIGFSPYDRAHIDERPALSRRAKGSQRRTQVSKSNRNTSSPLSFGSASPSLSHIGSLTSVTSMESNASPQASSPALPVEHSALTQTRPTAPRVSAPPPPHFDRTAVAELLTQFFKQPDTVAHRPKYRKADLLCQWVNTIGMVCSNRKWRIPGESLKDLTGRKAIGFCSGDRATVLRHMALHREEEMLQILCGCVLGGRRTIWDDLAIDAQLRLDSLG